MPATVPRRQRPPARIPRESSRTGDQLHRRSTPPPSSGARCRPPSTPKPRRTRPWSPTACTAGSACPPAPTYMLWGRETDSPRRPHRPHQGRPRGRDRRHRPLRPSLRTPASGAWRASPPAPPGCSTTSCSRPPRPQIERKVDPLLGGPAVQAPDLLAVPVPRAHAPGHRQAVGVPAVGTATAGPRERCAEPAAGPPARNGGAPAPGLVERRLDATAGPGARGGHAAAPGRPAPRMRAARVFFDEVNRATIRVLAAEGCEVVVPPRPGVLRAR